MSGYRDRLVSLVVAAAAGLGAVGCDAAPVDPPSARRPVAVEPPQPDRQPVQRSPWQPVNEGSWEIADPAAGFGPLTGADGGDPISRVLSGVHEGAGYRIEVPLDWNGDVVLWTHGYRGEGGELVVDDPGYDLRRTYVENGYAWAASSYSANRYDVGAAARSTEELARLFDREVGEPDRRYLQGVSMGGHVIGVLLERDSGIEWAGAAPMCGVMGDHEIYDFFLDYNLLAQTLAGVDAYPIPDEYVPRVVPRIKRALGTADGVPTTRAGEVFRDLVTEISGGPRPGDDAAFAFWDSQDFVYGVAAREHGGLDEVAPGAVWSNVDTDYPDERVVDGGVVLPDGQTLDEAVERVAPAPGARRTGPSAYIPDLTGDIDVPVLSIHTLGDYYVPFSMQQHYAADVAAQGDPDLLVQRAVRAAGHCEFTPEEARAQFLDLVDWVEDGVRPAGAPVLDREVVAAADYGCAFTTPTGTGTRASYPACPLPAVGR